MINMFHRAKVFNQDINSPRVVGGFKRI
jgi:hypothetical protein